MNRSGDFGETSMRFTPAETPDAGAATRLLVIAGFIIAALYFGAEVFVPIALAILLSFVLAPGVRLLRSWHLGRALPVLVMTTLACLAILALGALMATQVRYLASQLPQYEATMVSKAESLRSVTTGGVLNEFSEFLTGMARKMARDRGNGPASADAKAIPGPQPMPVVVQQPGPTPLQMLGRVLGPLLHPLATAVVVVVFVIFILLQREDLRNRLIRLFGGGDLHRSTAAIDDAAHRLSRYLLAQLGVNTGSGIVVGAALWMLGVPSPILWGILFACLRFVPYVGPPLGALMPIGLAAAVDPGWSLALWVLALFVVVETIVGQAVEPFFYGHNTGLSPLAVVVAAIFWTALWGPIGLILSTPMTVCLVVLGRHVKQLHFLDVLLGDEPPLSPPEVFYQRMLANDPVEASDQAHRLLREMTLTAYYESVVLPALVLAQDDVAQGRLDIERQRRIAEATAEVVEDLSDASPEQPAKQPDPGGDAEVILDKLAETEKLGGERFLATTPDPALAPGWREPGALLCLGSRGSLDDAAASLLAQLLAEHGFGATTAFHDMLLKANIGRADLSGVRLIALSCLDPNSAGYLRFVMRRLRRKAPGAKILIGEWWRGVDGYTPAGEEGTGESRAATLSEAVAFCIGHASAETPPHKATELAAEPVAARS